MNQSQKQDQTRSYTSCAAEWKRNSAIAVLIESIAASSFASIQRSSPESSAAISGGSARKCAEVSPCICRKRQAFQSLFAKVLPISHFSLL